MGLEKFDPALAIHDLIQDLKWSVELRAEFAANEAAVLDRHALRGHLDERQRLIRRERRGLDARMRAHGVEQR